MNKCISVIIPVFNSELFLERCLLSIIQQSYSNLQIIIVNDGSVDSSLKICEEFRDIDNRIQVINIENSGVSAARNIGLSVAEGNYIGFVDSDDWIEKDYYMELVKAIEKYQATIAVCGYVSEENENVQKSTNRDNIKIFDNNEAIEELFKGEIYMGHLCNKLYRSEVFKSDFLNENINMYEDLLFNTIAMVKSSKVVFIPTFGYHYIRHSNSSSSEINDRFFTVTKAYELMKEELRAHSSSSVKYCNKSQLRLYIITAIRMLNNGYNNKKYPKLLVKSVRNLLLETKNKGDFGFKYNILGWILFLGLGPFKLFYYSVGKRVLSK
ncbi:glycosyltransferase [Planococcus sp. 11815]|uniref:glycosyltransferase family 2 protein n=1 Tax=Planococcus sp. 11815 TaxID=2939413 RepID=UPI003DA1F207